MKPSITVGLARKEDTDRILELNRLEYGPADILATRADFAWRQSQNPAGQAVIVVIRDGHDEVVGFIWVVPLRMRVQGQDFLAATGTNLVIHPEYRDTFGYTKLMRRFQQAFKDIDVPLHFSFVSEKVYRQQLRRTPRSVATIPLLVRPLDYKALAQAFFANKWKGRMLVGAGGVASTFLFRKRPTTSSEIRVEVVDQFDPDFDEFWITVRDKYPAMVIRNRAFLQWRFARVSQRQYHVLVARAGQQMLGYTVLRCATIRGVKTGLVMDVLVSHGALGEMAGMCLMAEAETYFRARNMSVAAGLMASSVTEYRILRRAGYRWVPQAMSPRMFRLGFFVHCNGPGLSVTPAHNWFVTMADNESF